MDQLKLICLSVSRVIMLNIIDIVDVYNGGESAWTRVLAHWGCCIDYIYILFCRHVCGHEYNESIACRPVIQTRGIDINNLEVGVSVILI